MLITKRNNYFRPSFDSLYGLLEMILDFPTCMRGTPMIELGSYAGDSTQLFYLFFSPVISIDPHSWFMPPHKSVDEVKEQFNNNTVWRGIQYLNHTSHDVFEKPELEKLLPRRVCCVYIDADHCYGSVKRDILNSYPYICDDGFICGHDYGLTCPEAVAAKQDGVKQAVDEIFGEPDKLYRDTSWVVQKKPGRIKTLKG